VRDDHREHSPQQIALAVREEVIDLESIGRVVVVVCVTKSIIQN